MAKSPAFQWYPRDILASARVAEMSLAEEGADRIVSPDRRGFENVGEGMYKIRLLLDAPRVDVSSSMIREGLKKGEDMSRYLM